MGNLAAPGEKVQASTSEQKFSRQLQRRRKKEGFMVLLEGFKEEKVLRFYWKVLRRFKQDQLKVKIAIFLSLRS